MDASWFAVITVAVVALFVGLLQAKAKAAEIWKGETEAVRERANRLQDENQQLTEALTIAMGRTDITKVLELIGEQMRLSAAAQENHERRAIERHTVTVQAFGHLNGSLDAINRTLTSQAAATERRNAT